MSLPIIHTYKDGPTFKIGDSFTMRNVMNIIEKMNNAMPHHEFEPEPISEGGIRIKSDGKPFKTIRLRVKNWPWLTPGAEIDLDRELTCEKNVMYTFLKSFNGREKLCPEQPASHGRVGGEQQNQSILHVGQ